MIWWEAAQQPVCEGPWTMNSFGQENGGLFQLGLCASANWKLAPWIHHRTWRAVAHFPVFPLYDGPVRVTWQDGEEGRTHTCCWERCPVCRRQWLVGLEANRASPAATTLTSARKLESNHISSKFSVLFYQK